MKIADTPVKEQCIIETKCSKCGYYNEINVAKFFGNVKFDKESFAAIGMRPLG
jgi:hypothetical protein